MEVQASAGMPVVFRMEVPCPSAHAAVVRNSVMVDQELSPDKVSREITVGDNVLHVVYRGATLRNTRVAVHSCLQLMALALSAVCVWCLYPLVFHSMREKRS